MTNNQKRKKQIISFTKKQFLSLLKVVYLGNWMANAYRTNDLKKDYESIEDCSSGTSILFIKEYNAFSLKVFLY